MPFSATPTSSMPNWSNGTSHRTWRAAAGTATTSLTGRPGNNFGNLVSNTIIVGIALTVSRTTALLALVFLVLIHKLEYFLNSKIIGRRILNPLWLTLLALILGERLMGLPGMVLAPVILHYVKMEASRMPVEDTVNIERSLKSEV